MPAKSRLVSGLDNAIAILRSVDTTFGISATDTARWVDYTGTAEQTFLLFRTTSRMQLNAAALS